MRPARDYHLQVLPSQQIAGKGSKTPQSLLKACTTPASSKILNESGCEARAEPRSTAKFSSTVASGFANMACVEAITPRCLIRRRSESDGGHEAGTRGLAGLVGRELRSLTALLVERNGAQKTACQASWGEATASALCKCALLAVRGAALLHPGSLSSNHKSSRFSMPHSRFLGSEPAGIHR